MQKIKRCRKEEKTYIKNKNMKNISIIAVAVLMVSSCGEKVSMDAKVNNGLDSFSYVQGIMTASFLKAQGIENINFSAFYRGLNEGLVKDSGYLIQTNQINTFSQNYVQGQQKLKIKSLQAKSKEYIKGLSDKGYKSLPGGAYYKILTKGNGPNARAYDTVVMSLIIKNMAGAELFNSLKSSGGKQDKVPLAGLKLAPLEDALEIIPAGSTFELAIPTDLYPFLGQFARSNFNDKYGVSLCTFDISDVIQGKEISLPQMPQMPGGVK